MIDSATQHQAIGRLFDLVRNGDVDNLEYSQLDSLIYGGLEKTYHVSDADIGERTIQTTAV